MKYSQSIEISLPRERVIELLDNPDNMKHWQPDLVSYEVISGDAGKPGAKMKLLYKMGKRDVEMVETIIVRNFPDELSATYEAKGVWNKVENTFSEPKAGTTVWKSDNEFKLKGFMKIMAAVMPGAFKKQSYKYLKYFKEFAEKS